MSTWRLQVADPRGRRHDVYVDAEAHSSTADVAAAIEQLGFAARPLGLHGRALTSAPTIAALGLANGDTITCGTLGSPVIEPGPGWYVVAVSGPDAGRWAALPVGVEVTIGRQATLSLNDPLLSNQHCAVVLHRPDQVPAGIGPVSVRDLHSTNGTFVENVEVGEPRWLARGEYWQAGSSVLTVVELSTADLAVLGPLDGPDRVMPRQYRRALAALPTSLDAPRPLGEDSDSVLGGWWRALIPLVTGAGFAAMTGRWEFLLIMALAPIIGAIDAVRRKKGTTAKRRQKRAAAEAEQAEFRARLAELRRVERQRRRDATAIGGLAAFGASARVSTLWERSPGEEDFGAVGIGVASMPSPIEVKGGPAEPSELMWGSPVSTHLMATGSLAVVGEQQRCRAVARAFLVDLAAHHSPAAVRLTILTDDQRGDDWGFARWLPHSFLGDSGCRIGSDHDGRSRLLTAITQMMDTRREERGTSSGPPPLPIQVVVIDDTSLVSAAELTELLTEGPELGVVGITLDSRLAPEGAGATLTVTDVADTCVFQSRHQPRVDGVAIAQLSAEVAEAAARRLAALRPAISEEATIAGGVVHLIDLLDRPASGRFDGEHVAQRWRSIGPKTEVLVGMATGSPMRVDLVSDGPHGLVGGTSGSGKTEFLKTLFCALALNNHPDDLSIVIVDFKGGVDHEAVKPLPHVIDVATNLDIDQFKRTIVLLKAESRRRQDLLASAGASNIDSYRLARQNQPHLPSLPRLLVVVDEFGELLASEGGREQLKELESITRIGRALGLHLLLVTQNFDGNLPPQIDANAGMRVCLRVQKPAHSKAVLDSGVAATISDRNVGRAYARFHGRDLTEFQTARVAGRRRDLVAEAPVDARVVAFAALSTPPPKSRPEDVPVEETDMYLMLQSIREAAAATGWTASAVPWPASLPERVSAAALVERNQQPDAVPIGIADVPEEQRRTMVDLSERDQQVALLGGPSTPLGEVLATYATTLAATRSADDCHLYVIDLAGRALAPLGDLPHCGAVAVRNEALALRVLRWLSSEVAERKVMIAASGSSTVWEHASVTGELPAQIVLLVAGADRMIGSEGPVAGLLGPLMSLLTEAVGVRVQIVIAGLAKIVGHRLGTNIEQRFVFQLADIGELNAAGAPRAVAADLRTERRAYDTVSRRIVQFARLAEPGAPEGAAIRRLAESLPPAQRRPPRRFADVSWPLAWEQCPWDRMDPPGHITEALPVGIGTDDGEWAWVDLDDDGPVFSVAGSPKSGRSTALATIARLAGDRGYPVINVVMSKRSPLAASTDPVLAECRVGPGELGAALERTLATTNRRVVVVMDDLQRLTEADPIEALMAHRDRIFVVVAGSPDLLGSRMGVLRSLPMSTAGLLLAPLGSLDGGAIGLRRLAPEATNNPRPGRGLLAVSGEAVEVQLPLPSAAH